MSEQFEDQIIGKLRGASKNGRVQVCEARGEGGIWCEVGNCKAHVITQKLHTLARSGGNMLMICKEHELYFNERPLKEWYRFVKKRHPDKFQWVASKYQYVIREYEELMKIAEEG